MWQTFALLWVDDSLWSRLHEESPVLSQLSLSILRDARFMHNLESCYPSARP